MFLLAALLFITILFVFAGATAIIAFHLKRYAVPGDHTARVLRVFLIGSGFFLIFAVIAFLAVPWSEFLLSL